MLDVKSIIESGIISKMENNKMNINWFPGHMAKATREIKEKLNLVDMVIELCDARAPIASINPVVKELVNNKYYLKVMTKIDLADEKESLIYKTKFESVGIPCVFVNLNNKESIKPITAKIKEVARPIIEKDLKRGLKPRNIRVMIVGIPNVGKSTLINLLAKRKSAPVGNMPGFTRAQKWVHCDGFDLLDTPGILWPNLTENNSGIKLALIGCIKEDILPREDLVKYALNYLNDNYKEVLYNKYNIEYIDSNDYLEKFAISKGHLLKNNEVDTERSASLILNDLKNGRIGRITIEKWEDR